MTHEKPTILIADDEDVIRQVVKRMLGDDYTILEATNGEEAVNLARSHQPGIILMDTFMPKMDGYTACFELKRDETTRDIPVVAVTGQGGPLQEKMAKTIGVKGFLGKPFTKGELLEAINALLDDES